MSSRKNAAKLHPAALRAKLDAEIWLDPRELVARAKAAFWSQENEKTRQWLAAHVERIDPEPDQPCGTLLGSKIGLKKGSTEVSRFYGRTSDIRKERWGTVVHASLDCRGTPPAKLRRAFARMHKMQLRQMQNSDLKPAGIVLDAAVLEDGFVVVKAVVSDTVAARKLADRTYSGLLLSMDGDDVADVSLVDSPAGFLDLEKRAPEVIAQVIRK